MISVFSVILRYILTSELDVHYTKSWQARRPQPSATLWQQQPCPAAAPCPGPLRALRGFLGGIFPAPQGKALPVPCCLQARAAVLVCAHSLLRALLALQHSGWSRYEDEETLLVLPPQCPAQRRSLWEDPCGGAGAVGRHRGAGAEPPGLFERLLLGSLAPAASRRGPAGPSGPAAGDGARCGRGAGRGERRGGG